MTFAENDAMVTMPSPGQQSGDESMVGRERWEAIRRLFYEERRSISAVDPLVPYYLLTTH
ncbi:MAG: hypothetical protein MN733_01770 [Nitrososphaera sp.]|nr:hypothetical protein [Nitrososphaera sp.]